MSAHDERGAGEREPGDRRLTGMMAVCRTLCRSSIIDFLGGSDWMLNQG